MKTLLLDRDGVLIVRRHYDYTPENIELLPGVGEALAKLTDYQFFVVGNQSGIGRGLYADELAQATNASMVEKLAAHNVHITDVAYCPHHPDDDCTCRKPRIGMWEQLKSRYNLQAEDCLMVGDRGSDIEFGKTIGCKTAFVTHNESNEGDNADIVVANLPELITNYLV